MADLNSGEWRRVCEATRRVSAISDVGDFHRHVTGVVDELLPHGLASSELHDLSKLEMVSSAQTRDDEHFNSLMPAFAAHLHEHPCLDAALATRDLKVMGIRDRMDAKSLHRLGLYNEFYRHVEIEDQIIIAKSQGFPALLALAISRDLPFTPEERLMLELFAPALGEAHANWLAMRQASQQNDWALSALEHLRCGVMHLDTSGQLLDFNQPAEHITRRYFGVGLTPRRLPLVLVRWHAEMARREPGGRETMVREKDEGRAEFRFVASSSTGGSLIVCREQSPAASREALLSLGLTPALAEVLRLACLGLTSKQIATQLGKSDRTVATQMNQVLRRLGVDNKAAAVAIASRLL